MTSVIPSVSHLGDHLCFTEYCIFQIEFINVARRLEIPVLFRKHEDGLVFTALFRGVTDGVNLLFPTHETANPSTITARLGKMVLPSSGSRFGDARQGKSMSEVPRGRDEATALRRWCSRQFKGCNELRGKRWLVTVIQCQTSHRICVFEWAWIRQGKDITPMRTPESSSKGVERTP